MIKTSHMSTRVMILLTGLPLMLTSTVLAQKPIDTSTEPVTLDQSTAGTIADRAETDLSTQTDRCPRCGLRQDVRRRRGAGAPSDSSGGGCRTGQGRQAQALGRHGHGHGRGRERHGVAHRAEMAAYRALLENHQSIERTFEEIPGGIRSITSTSIP